MDISIIAGVVLFVVISIAGLYKKRRSQQKHNTTSTNPHFEWVEVPEKRELKTIQTTERQFKYNPKTGQGEWVDAPVTKTEWVVTEPAHKEYVYKED